MGNIMTNQHANSDHSPERAEENKKTKDKDKPWNKTKCQRFAEESKLLHPSVKLITMKSQIFFCIKGTK